MVTPTQLPPCTIEGVVATYEATFKDYGEMFQRISTDTSSLAVLHPLQAALAIMQDRLESAVEDADMVDRLEGIIIQNQGQDCGLLPGLNNDLQSIGQYLRKTNSNLRPGYALEKDLVDMLTQSLVQYNKIFKRVERMNDKDIMKRIAAEVALLNEALSRMHSSISLTGEPSPADLYIYLDRLRPLRLAFHDSGGAPGPSQDPTYQETIDAILTWFNMTTPTLEHPNVLWISGDDRFATSAVAQSLATHAYNEGRLLSSYFFSWKGEEKQRNYDDLIPTITYKIAQYDDTLLRKITQIISANPDVRDKAANTQIRLLLKEPLENVDISVAQDFPLLIIIDALDTCNDLEDPKVAEDINNVIRTLILLPSRIKILMTSRLYQPLKQITLNPKFPRYRRMELPRHGRTESEWRRHDAKPSHGEKEILDFLEPVYSARWNSLESPSGCLEGTRVDIVATISEWCTQASNHFSVYWLAGHAGTGKSAIAKTLCEKLTSMENIWIFTFFISRFSAERRDPFRILYSLACELARRDVVVCQRVLSAIRSNPDVKQCPLREQIQKLLCAAIEACIGIPSIVLVIDALDECASVNKVEGGSLIHDLAHELVDLPIKLVLTSRMQESLVRSLGSLPSRVTQLLHEIEATSVTLDIRRIFAYGFEKIRMKRAIVVDEWPSTEDLELLVQRAGRFVIFASTVLKFVASDRFSPESRLKQILHNTSIATTSVEFSQVDALYLDVLLVASQSDLPTRQIDPILRDRIRRLTGTLILLQEPLSINALAQLLDVSEYELDRDVHALSAVLLIGPETDSSGSLLVQVFHTSFRDFLVDRCDNEYFRIDESAQHHLLALCSLNTLNRTLKRDLCDISNPGLPNIEVIGPHVPVSLRRYVPAPTAYACGYWIPHARHSGTLDESLVSAIWIFANAHLLHWVEALSLLGYVPHMIKALPHFCAWLSRYKSSLQREELIDVMILLNDVFDMLRVYQAVIATHALQVYSSAQATMSHCRLFEVSLASSLDDLPRLILRQRQDRTGSTVFTNPLNHETACLAFSPDGLRIVSGGDDGTLQLWDTPNGQELMVLQEGCPYRMQAVAFSPRGSQIASGSSEGVIQLWDSLTGQHIASIKGHTRGVLHIAFSLDGSQIVSSSDDWNICLWNSQTRQQIAILKGHTSAVYFTKWLPDGSQLVSGSADRTVRIWDVTTEMETAKFDRIPKRSRPLSVATASNKLRIAAFYGKSHAIHTFLWDSKTGKEHDRETIQDKVRDVTTAATSFSPDGSLFAVAVEGEPDVRVFYVPSGLELVRLKAHNGSVLSVAFSPDNVHVAFGLRDATIRLQNIYTSRDIVQGRDRLRGVNSVDFSPNGLQILCTSDDGTVDLIDAHTGRNIADLGKAERIAFSPDGLHVACGGKRMWSKVPGFNYGRPSVQVWNVHTGQKLPRFQDFEALTNFTSVVFSPDGAMVASSTEDDIVRLWNVHEEREVVMLRGHTPLVRSIAFSPDGQQIGVSSYGGRGHNDSMRIWNVETGDEVANLSVDIRVEAIKFLRDGSQCIVCSTFGAAQLWNKAPGTIITLEDRNKAFFAWARSTNGHTVRTDGERRSRPSTRSRLTLSEALSDLANETKMVEFLKTLGVDGTEAQPGCPFFDSASGWISWISATQSRSFPLCWLPPDLRGEAFSSYGVTFVVASQINGQLTIIDFAPMLTMLRRIHVMT